VELTILLADDRVSCEDWDHDIIQYLSLLLIIVVAIGMPIGFAVQLWCAYKALPDPDEAALDRHKTAAGELGLTSVDEATALFRNVCIGANYGSLVDTVRAPARAHTVTTTFCQPGTIQPFATYVLAELMRPVMLSNSTSPSCIGGNRCGRVHIPPSYFGSLFAHFLVCDWVNMIVSRRWT
jgi:hypothetical protein